MEGVRIEGEGGEEEEEADWSTPSTSGEDSGAAGPAATKNARRSLSLSVARSNKSNWRENQL